MEDSSPDNNNNLDHPTEKLRNYLQLPATLTREFEEELKKARETRSDLDIEGSGSKLELHILRALDSDQLKADTFAVCTKLISEGIDVIPVTELKPEALTVSGDGPAVHLIWEGNFGARFSSSAFISDLIHGYYSSRLKSRIVIVSMSWASFEEYFGKKGKEIRQISRTPVSMGANLRIGIFLLGIAMLMSVASPFLVSVTSTYVYTLSTLLGDISLAATVAGLILLVTGLSASGYANRVRVYALIIAFILIYSVSTVVMGFESVYSSLTSVIFFGTSLSVTTTFVFFLMLLSFSDFRRSIFLYIATGLSLAYALYAGLSTYYMAMASFTNIVAFSGFIVGSQSFFSFSLPYLNYYPVNSGNIISTVLFVAASLMFSALFFWTSIELDWEDKTERPDDSAPTAA